MAELKRNVGLFGAASVGIASIIGAGIFVLSGVAAGLAGPSVIISFFIAGLTALLTALSTAELASYITETGAAYTFTKRAFGRFWSFLVGWFKYFDYVVGAAAVSIGFAAYLTKFLGVSGTVPLVAASTGLPVVLTVLNLIGIKETAYAMTGMVVVKVCALVLLVVLGVSYLTQNVGFTHYTPFFPNGFGGTLNGAAVIFFAFIGFNTVAMMSEETREPHKTIPRALMLAFCVSFVLYCLIAIVEVGALDWRDLGRSGSPLEDLAKRITTRAAIIDFVVFSALVATGSVVLSSIVGGTRAGFAMARDRLLPHALAKVHGKSGAPYVAIIVSGLVITALAGIFYNDIDTIASVFNFGSLFTYLFVHLSLMKLRRSEPGATRLFKIPLYPVLPILGAASCVFLMYYLSATAKIASSVWLVVGLVVFAFLARQGRREGTGGPPAQA